VTIYADFILTINSKKGLPVPALRSVSGNKGSRLLHIAPASKHPLYAIPCIPRTVKPSKL